MEEIKKGRLWYFLECYFIVLLIKIVIIDYNFCYIVKIKVIVWLMVKDGLIIILIELVKGVINKFFLF